MSNTFISQSAQGETNRRTDGPVIAIYPCNEPIEQRGTEVMLMYESGTQACRYAWSRIYGRNKVKIRRSFFLGSINVFAPVQWFPIRGNTLPNHLLTYKKDVFVDGCQKNLSKLPFCHLGLVQWFPITLIKISLTYTNKNKPSWRLSYTFSLSWGS